MHKNKLLIILISLSCIAFVSSKPIREATDCLVDFMELLDASQTVKAMAMMDTQECGFLSDLEAAKAALESRGYEMVDIPDDAPQFLIDE